MLILIIIIIFLVLLFQVWRVEKMNEKTSGFTESTVCFHESTPLNRRHKTWRNLVAFWILGLCNNYGYVVMLTAANDIIIEQEEGHHVVSVQSY